MQNIETVIGILHLCPARGERGLDCAIFGNSQIASIKRVTQGYSMYVRPKSLARKAYEVSWWHNGDYLFSLPWKVVTKENIMYVQDKGSICFLARSSVTD